MRKFAWLTLAVTAALFFGAPERAFAHAAHHHVEQAQNAGATGNVLPVAESKQHAEQFVSAVVPDAGKCPHGQKQADCGFCCACAGGVSVALATPEAVSRAFPARSEHSWLAVQYEVRHAVLDLSRPPKSFA